MHDATPAAGEPFGRYVLRRPLGKGAGGEVWEAVLRGPHGFEKPVALKLLRTAGAGDARGLAAEARLGALVSHPHVVSTLDLGEVRGIPYVAMELVRGASAAELLGSAGPLPPSAALEVAIHTCSGLAHVHMLRVEGRPAGLVHRDVKPGNVLVDRSGLARLADLGVAQLAGTAAGTAGTPGYMPPEQVGGRAEPRSDLFAVGVMLTALLVAILPFGRGPEALRRVARCDEVAADPNLARALDQRAPGVSRIVERCLRADPSARWSSAAELGAALSALRASLPPGPTLLDVLQRRRPEVGGEVTQSLAPVSSSAETVVLVRGNLAVSCDRFVGRAHERREVNEAFVRGERIVTLLGPGGAGKTRLAIEAARDQARALPGGAWFADLSEARTGPAVCEQLARALEVPLDPEDPARQLGYALRARGAVLVVADNLEQVVNEASPLLAAWLAAAPEVRFLCTTQRVLPLRGARHVALGPLAHDAAVELFVDRAPRASAPEHRPEVDALVDALDGLPLEIELAAARTRVLPIRTVRERLSERLRVLAGGGAERPARHRSLQASLENSTELLPEWARAALARLSVFQGEFELEAAEAVLDLSAFPEAPWAIDAVSALVDASLLRVVPVTGRFCLPEVVRAFAAQRLDDAARARVRARHGSYFAQRGEVAHLDALYRHGATGLRALLSDVDDLLAACTWAVERGDGAVAAGTCRAASVACALGGRYERLIGLAERVLGIPDLAPADRVRTLLVLSRACAGTTHVERARAPLEEALHGARTLGDENVEARVRIDLSYAAMDDGRFEDAREHLDRAVAMARRQGERRVEALALGGYALLAERTGQLDEARRFHESAVALAREVGDRHSEGIWLGGLARIHHAQGRTAESDALCEASIALHREVGAVRSEVVQITQRALHLAETGQTAEARVQYRAAIATARRIGDRKREGVALGNLGVLCALVGDPEAGIHLAAALQAHRDVGNDRSEGQALANLGYLMLDAGRFDEARARLEEALRLHERAGDEVWAAIDRALLGRLALRRGDLEAAEPLLRDALAALGDRHAYARATFEGSLALVVCARGRVDEARQLVALAKDRATAGRWSHVIGELCCAEAELCLAEEDRAGAQAALDRALQQADHAGLERDAPLRREMRKLTAAIARVE